MTDTTSPADVTGRSHRVPLRDLTIRYLEWGDADAPVLLMLHGLRSYAATFEPIATAYADRYRVIAPDFRGRDGSDWDPQRNYFTPAYLDDTEQLLDALGLDRVTVLGHSMGGTVGYALAAQHPDRVEALVVEDIGPGSSTATAGADRVLRELDETPPEFSDLDAVVSYWRGIRPDVTEEALASRIAHTVHEVDGRWVWRLDMAGIAAARRQGDPAGPIDLWACVDGLQCPTLVVRGARSDFLPTDVCLQMAQRQPLIEWAEIPAAGHYVHDDNPADFLAVVTRFLDRVGADTEVVDVR